MHVEILATSKNQKGDLFGRLIDDYFYSLGYGPAAHNVANSGREIDLRADHRVESRTVIGEAKAHEEKIGGGDINKFYGAGTRQGLDESQQIELYFVSLSGFKDSAIEQERGVERLHLVDSTGLVEELCRGNFLISPERAAGTAEGLANRKLKASDPVLLAHEIGWLWLVTLCEGKKPVSFCIIHADGEPLGQQLVESLASFRFISITTAGLESFNPRPAQDTESRDEIDRDYCRQLLREYSSITFEGLPANETVGSHAIQLKELYVDLHLRSVAQELAEEEGAPTRQRPDALRGHSLSSTHDALDLHRQIAVLGAPGSGKSTIVRRLATLAAEVRLEEGPVSSPLPLVLRCRHLDLSRDNVPSIVDLLGQIPSRLELDVDQGAFVAHVRASLRAGTALLLVDGLDEITDEGTRVRFVHQLRAFVGQYSAIQVVVTSRFAGFRSVAPALAGTCVEFAVADLRPASIRKLTRNWHRLALGESTEATANAEKVAEEIIASRDVSALARNPLLLTTLLLVQRWVGKLPSKRSSLYEKAIEVLLLTWNVEAHDPIDLDEAVPQLAFLAFEMHAQGSQEISLTRLTETLAAARAEMPEVVNTRSESVSRFIKRIEARSSLIAQTGHRIADGALEEVYEFRHLQFQEYLVAKAVVEGYVPLKYSPSAGQDSVESLVPFLNSWEWVEVSLISISLANRRSSRLVDHVLTEARSIAGSEDWRQSAVSRICWELLVQEGAWLTPDRAEAIAEVNIREWRGDFENNPHDVVGKRHEGALRRTLARLLEDEGSYCEGALSFSVDLQAEERADTTWLRTWKEACELMEDDSQGQRLLGAGLAVSASYSQSPRITRARETPEVERAMIPKRYLSRTLTRLEGLLTSGTPNEQVMACWALAWMGTYYHDQLVAHARLHEIVQAVFQVYRREGSSRFSAWALWALPLSDRKRGLEPAGGNKALLRRKLSGSSLHGDEYRAALVAAAYLGEPWGDADIIQMAETHAMEHDYVRSRMQRLVAWIGSEPAPTPR